MVFGSRLKPDGENFLPTAVVPFPRGCAFGHDGRFFLASGIGPNGVGDNAIVAFERDECTLPVLLVSDPELSPLDLTIAPDGNIVVSSEHPFGATVSAIIGNPPFYRGASSPSLRGCAEWGGEARCPATIGRA
jgi:hypothetical protein